LTALASRPVASAGVEPSVDQAQLTQLAAENAALRAQIAGLTRRLDELGGLANRVAALDAALAAVPAARKADGGGALVVTVGQLAAAVAAARPYAAELEAVKGIVAADPALATKANDLLSPLASRQATGVPTGPQLAAGFAAVADAISQAARQQSLDDGWLDRSIAEALSVVTVRPVGDVAGDDPASRAARAEYRLTAQDLAGAVAELAGLTGAPAEAAASWLADANFRLAADQAIAALQLMAIEALGASAAPAANAGG